MELIAFYGFASLILAAALFILFTKNLMYAVFGLFLTFLGVSALYVFAMADFLAVAQIMIYVGGVLVLMIFGIMLTHQRKSGDSTQSNYVLVENKGVPFRIALSGLFLFLLLRVILRADFVLQGDYTLQKSTLEKLGFHLMTTHVLPFELMAFLLLMVLVGAGYLAYNRIRS